MRQFGFVCIVVAALTANQMFAQTAARGDAGFVISVRGRWDIVRPGMAPKAADPRAVLREGDILSKVDPDPASAVVIALYTGDVEEVKLTTTLPSRSSGGIAQRFERIVRVLQNRLRPDSDFVNASVRGGGDFQEAILKAESDRTDFLAMFGDAPPGTSTIAVFELTTDGTVKRPARVTARIQVDAASARGPALAPGLYRVDVSDGPAGLAGSAWIRVVPEDRFQAAAGELAHLRSPGAGDAGSAQLREAVRAVARTYLIAFDDIPSESR